MWEMYDAVEPFGDYRSDLQAAQIASYIFNMAVKKEDRKPLLDFVLPFPNLKTLDPPEERQPIVITLPQGPVTRDKPLTEEENKALFDVHKAMHIAAMYAAGGFSDKVKEQ